MSLNYEPSSEPIHGPIIGRRTKRPRRMERKVATAYPNTPTWYRGYRVTSLIRNRHPVGPYSRTMPRLLWRS